MPFVTEQRPCMVEVELIYLPLNEPSIHLRLALPAGATVEEVLKQANVLPSILQDPGLSVGIFSKRVPLDTLVKTGDRIEVYRPLMLHPMEKRRRHARSKK